MSSCGRVGLTKLRLSTSRDKYLKNSPGSADWAKVSSCQTLPLTYSFVDLLQIENSVTISLSILTIKVNFLSLRDTETHTHTHKST